MANLIARFLELPTEYPARQQKVHASEEISAASSSKSGHNGLSGPVMETDWPRECIESEKRMGMRYARLFPLLGREVRIPSGRGVLVQVFAERVAVIVSGKINFLSPDKVLPLSTEQLGLDRECTARCQTDSEDSDGKSNDC
jgi:hypothetical protein